MWPFSTCSANSWSFTCKSISQFYGIGIEIYLNVDPFSFKIAILEQSVNKGQHLLKFFFEEITAREAPAVVLLLIYIETWMLVVEGLDSPLLCSACTVEMGIQREA
jgi:hypothetical protein